MTVKLPDVSEFQSPASGNAPNWAGIKSQNGGAAIIRVGYGNAHLDGMLVSNRATIKSLKFGFCGLYQYLRACPFTGCRELGSTDGGKWR
jgi:hypothetical protein